jgi:DNA-binding MarR family transcriptional regulator
MSELSKHTRLFNNVKACTELNWQEKAILSEIISYQLNGDVFDVKDSTLSYRLGMDKGTISKFINRLHKKGLINKITSSYQNQSGNKPKRLRTITVIDIELWTEKGKTPPTIKAIEAKPKKATSVEIVETPVIKTEITSTETNTIQLDVKPVVKTKKVVKEKSLEELLHEADSKKVVAPSTIEKTSTGAVLTIDAFTDVDNTTATGNIIADKIRNDEKFEFVNVLVEFGENNHAEDEAMLIPNSNKYYLKSRLKAIDESIVE